MASATAPSESGSDFVFKAAWKKVLIISILPPTAYDPVNTMAQMLTVNLVFQDRHSVARGFSSLPASASSSRAVSRHV